MPKHLCVIVDRATKRVRKEYTVEAEDWYYARHQAARIHTEQHGDGNWYVDSMELEKE